MIVVEADSLSREGSKYLEVIPASRGRDFLRLARLLRGETKLIAELGGRTRYEQLKAYYLWNVYFVIKKIDDWVWILQKGLSR